MKKYFKIVNRVFLNILNTLLVIYFFSCFAVYAQINNRGFSEGTNSDVIYRNNLKPSIVKNLNEVKETIDNINKLELNVTIRPSATESVLQVEEASESETSERGINNQGSQSSSNIINKDYDSNVSSILYNVTNYVHRNCTQFGNGVVKKVNKDCLNNLTAVISNNSATAIGELKTSANSYNAVQCVACVRSMTQAFGKPYTVYGDAKTHINGSSSLYRYVSNKNLSKTQRAQQIKEGSLFIDTNGPYGHIGVVAKININASGEADSFLAQECNYEKPGYFSIGRIINFSQIEGFQVPI